MDGNKGREMGVVSFRILILMFYELIFVDNVGFFFLPTKKFKHFFFFVTNSASQMKKKVILKCIWKEQRNEPIQNLLRTKIKLKTNSIFKPYNPITTFTKKWKKKKTKKKTVAPGLYNLGCWF